MLDHMPPPGTGPPMPPHRHLWRPRQLRHEERTCRTTGRRRYSWTCARTLPQRSRSNPTPAVKLGTESTNKKQKKGRKRRELEEILDPGKKKSESNNTSKSHHPPMIKLNGMHTKKEENRKNTRSLLHRSTLWPNKKEENTKNRRERDDLPQKRTVVYNKMVERPVSSLFIPKMKGRTEASHEQPPQKSTRRPKGWGHVSECQTAAARHQARTPPQQRHDTRR